MSKIQMPLVHDSYAKFQIADYLLWKLREYLDLPDSDDEMRENKAGLDVKIEVPNDALTIRLVISAHEANGAYGRFTDRNYTDVMETLLFLDQKLPDGLEFYEIFRANSRFIEVNYIIQSDSKLRCWYDANIRY